jgi:S-formylglutathione hydrolase FrmB
MLYQPDAFGSYGMMSAGFPPAITSLSPYAAALMGKSIFVGAGWQDPIFAVGFGNSHTGPQKEVGLFAAAGIPMTPDFINGGHEWYVWRILLKDFLTRVAFMPPVAR